MTGITSFDFFGLPETPNFLLCNPNGEQLYSLGGISERKYSPRFNALSSLEFRADEYINGTLNEYYAYLAHRRLIYIEELSTYFMINSVSEKGDGISKYKQIGCQSLEVELINKKLSLFTGTYQLYNTVTPSGTLIAEILEYLPGWTVGTIDTEIAVKYRTFDISDSTIYNFLMTDVEEAFQCVFSFDTVNKTISAYTLDNATSTTDIYISYDNVIENIVVDEITDNLVTALTVLGGGGLSVNRVNPLGTNNIYDLTYFKDTDWTNQALIDAITAWEVLIAANQANYASLLADLLTQNETLVTLESDLDELNTELSVLEIELAGLIQAGTTNTSSKNAEIINKRLEITNKTSDITNQESTVDAIIAQLEGINTTLSFDSNFTSDQQIELQPFIIQSSYINENFELRDNMSGSAIQAEAQLLYDQAMDVLSRVSEPRYTFDVDSVNFMMISDFQNFIDQIELGAIINLEIKEGVVTYPVLLGFDLNYDSPTDFKLIFGNRLRLDDEAFQYSDLINEAISAGTTSKVNSLQWNSWSNNYKDDVSSFITSSLDASLNNVISGSSQDIIIDKSGLRGRTVVAGEYSDEQIWLVNNMIAFTDDGWDSAKMAIGYLTSGSGSVWGVVADHLVGRVVAANTLTITNEDSTFTVDGSGATLTDADFTVNTSDGKSIINIDPNVGIKIRTNIGGTFGDRFYVDTAGNLVLAGKITATSGNIGGWTINTSGLYYNSTNYIYPTSLKLANGVLSISGGTATFSGDIYANKLIGIVDWSQISNIPHTQVTSGYGAGRLTVGSSQPLSGQLEAPYGISTNSIAAVGTVQVGSWLSAMGGLYDGSSRVATQSWVTGMGYITQGTADGRYAYKSHSHSGTYHPYVGSAWTISRIAIDTPYGVRYISFQNGILTYYGT